MSHTNITYITEENSLTFSHIEHRYFLLRYLEPCDLARTQECSRALCFVAGQETLWYVLFTRSHHAKMTFSHFNNNTNIIKYRSRLATYRKQNKRLDRRLPPHVRKLDGKTYLKLEFESYKAQSEAKCKHEREMSIGSCRMRLMYPHGRIALNSGVTIVGMILFLSTLVCTALASIPIAVLLPFRADDSDSTENWTPWLVPSYILLALVRSVSLPFYIPKKIEQQINK